MSNIARAASARRAAAPVWTASGILPARRAVQETSRSVAHRGPTSSFRLFSSLKEDLLLPAESKLEFDFLTVMEANPDVAHIRVQPEMTLYEDVGGLHRYYPDVLVDMHNGSACMVEVKPAYFARRAAMKTRFEVLRAHYRRRGLLFIVASEAFIRRQPRLMNCRTLMSCRHVKPSPALAREVAEAIAAAAAPTLGRLQDVLGVPDGRRSELLALALKGQFRLDLDTGPISSDTLVSDGARPLNRLLAPLSGPKPAELSYQSPCASNERIAASPL